MTSAMVAPMRVRDRVVRRDHVRRAPSRGATSTSRPARSPRTWRCARPPPSTTPASTAPAPTIAQTLQASLLPPVLPEVPGVEAGALYRAGRRGATRSAATSTTSSRPPRTTGSRSSATSAARAPRPRPSRRWRATRSAPRRSGAAHRPRSCAGSTRRCCAEEPDALLHDRRAHLDRSRRPTRLTVAVGGHPLPLMLRADGAVEEAGAPGTLIGLVERPELEDALDRAARPATRVLLYTDGAHRGRGAGRRLDARGARARRRVAARPRPRRNSSDRVRAMAAPRPRGAAARRHRDARAAAAPLGVAGRGAVLVVGGARRRPACRRRRSCEPFVARRPRSGASSADSLAGSPGSLPGGIVRCRRADLRQQSPRTALEVDLFGLGVGPLLRVGQLVLRLALALLGAALRRSEASSARSPAAFLARPLILSVVP